MEKIEDQEKERSGIMGTGPGPVGEQGEIGPGPDQKGPQGTSATEGAQQESKGITDENAGDQPTPKPPEGENLGIGIDLSDGQPEMEEESKASEKVKSIFIAEEIPRLDALNSINTSTRDGKLLMAALIRLTTELDTNKTPYEVLGGLEVMVSELDKADLFKGVVEEQAVVEKAATEEEVINPVDLLKSQLEIAFEVSSSLEIKNDEVASVTQKIKSAQILIDGLYPK